MKNIDPIIILILIIIQGILSIYPEDYSTIELLTNPQNYDSENDEIFIGSFYHSGTSTSLPYNDHRNGVKVKPKNFNGPSPSTFTSIYYSGMDDDTWGYSQTNKIFYPPTINLINSCISGINIILNLYTFIDSESEIIAENYDLSYIFYFWIEKGASNTNPIYFSCNDGSTDLISFASNNKGLYQLYLKYNYLTKTFSKIGNPSASFRCDIKQIKISNTNALYMKRLKLTGLVSYDKLKNINCNNLDGKCPSSYYCDVNTGECKKCLGIFSECQNRESGQTCGRFTEEWQNSILSQTSCTPDYFNLQHMGEMSFDITPPIKSTAASLSFWIFTLIDANEAADGTNSNRHIYHISLEDFFVVTIIPGKTKYTIYLTAYQMYHEAYGYNIQKIKTEEEFLVVMNKFPYKDWYIKGDINKMNRWVSIIVTFNKNVPRIGMEIYYKKSSGSNDLNLKIYKNVNSEYIYNNNDISQSNLNSLHFKKFYRNSDVMHLNVNIYDNNIGVYIRKIYTFATELIIQSTASTWNQIFGFQYIEYEKIFSSENALMPELVLAVPFDKISKLESEEGQYSIRYYMYDLTKIHNNKIEKYLMANPGDIDDSLYYYDPRLYRLNLISDTNRKYSSSILENKIAMTCNGNNLYCYENNLAYTCRTGYLIDPSQHICISYTSYTGKNILVPGINAASNKLGTLTQICYDSPSSNNCLKNILTENQCASSSFKFYDACISNTLSQSIIGYFYYSYFFKLPPIKINLRKIYKSYYIQFNFLYETNSALRPLEESFKGKKIYLFYTDAFRIWHDYSMKYMGIEDTQGNPSKNIITNFNTENENTFTISVNFDDIKNIYSGKIFLNGVKINALSFTGDQLSYILFCHNDTACPAGGKIYWTSGFYNLIRIYDLDQLTVLNDNSFYDQYIYNNYYSYYNYGNGKQRFSSYPLMSGSTEEIRMDIVSMATYNQIGGYQITSYYSNEDKLQIFNYGIDQTPQLRKLGNSYTDEKYINKNHLEERCFNSLSCYGGSNPFSQESKSCGNNQFYKYDECNAFPSTKDMYYTLTFPLKEDIINPITNNYIYIKLPLLNNDAYSRKVTYTFWIKLICYKERNIIFLVGSPIYSFTNINQNDGYDRCYLEYKNINTISFICKMQNNNIIYGNEYTIPKKYYGKYIHISISLSLHRIYYSSSERTMNFFVSFQVNNENIPYEDSPDLSSVRNFLINIQEFYLGTNLYAQISKFYIYREVLIGGYAYNTNKNILDPTYKLIDDNRVDCLLSGNSPSYDTRYKCIQDYSLVFNDDYYINGAYPNEQKVFLAQNEMHKIKKCDEECGYFCSGTKQNQCSCATNGFYDYIFKKKEPNKISYECKKLPSADFKRYKSFTFTINPKIYSNGFDFWFYATKGVNDYTNSKLLFSIRRELTWVNLISIYNNKIECRSNFILKFDNTLNEGGILRKWNYVSCSGTPLDINNIIFINEENDITSHGIMLIRQFRLWKNFNEWRTTELKYTELLSKINQNYLYLSIDSYKKIFLGYKSQDISITEQYTQLTNEQNYGYSPIEDNIPELELCSEAEVCQNVIKLNAIKDLEFKQITPSGTGRYTMEFWIKIKSVKKFLAGINIVWDKHISISILTDALKDKLSIYCFPQDYLTSPLGHEGRDIISLANSALNNDNIDLDINTYENVWFYTRCTYNWDNEIYYLKYDTNPVQIKDVVHETASFGPNKVDYPFKYLFKEYDEYNFIIQNANRNENSDVKITTLYLYNEYLPVEYDTQRILFSYNKKPIWLVFGIDFKKYNNIELKYFDNKENIEKTQAFEKIKEPFESRGGVVLCEPNTGKVFDSETNECVPSLNNPITITEGIGYDNIYIQCNSNKFLTLENNNNICQTSCTGDFNRGPGSLMDMDASKAKTALCNYKLSNFHTQYHGIDDYSSNLLCTNGYVRVGYKCLSKDSQENSALYFNRCYNFYPFYADFTNIQSKLLNGYIIEFSFKIDLVNDFCPVPEGDRYLFYAYPHAIIQDQNNIFYYKDIFSDHTEKIEQISLYEWNYIIIETNLRTTPVINLYINYNMTHPVYSYELNSDNLNNYILKNLLFCQGEQNLCTPLEFDSINWGAAYYSKLRIYDIRHSSVYMIYENMRNKFKYLPESILVYYLFNTIDNDLNTFHDTVNNINLEFQLNLPFVSVYKSNDKTLMFSSSSNFDYGQLHPQIYVTSVKKITGEYTSSNCFDHCKRCYSSEKNDCYECMNGYELFNKQCREITGYYFQLPNYQKEMELKTESLPRLYNPITITLWVKYFGIIKDSGNVKPVGDCILLIRFSIEDDIFICLQQESNNLFMYKNSIILFEDTTFISEQGKWQLISVSNYKCNYNNENTCNYFPSMISLAINGKVATHRNWLNIPENGITINTITFGYGTIMSMGDVNIYNTFILNPLGIVSNILNRNNYLKETIKLYSSSSSNCIDTQVLISSDGRDMYYQNDNNCFADYNIYHDLGNYNCNNEDKMVNVNSVDSECKDCEDDCKFCAGESNNCACYYNTNYWFRNDNNVLRCQIVPYIDLNKYSDLQFSEIKYATTNEYAIEFWYFIYEYNENEINFYRQIISWENHIKIEISKYSNDLINVECFPINEKDESISTNDVSQRYFKWNHIICATDLNKKIYYLNEGKVNNIIGEGVKQLNFSTYDNRRVTLRFQSFDNLGDKTSHGVFLLKELRLWNLFSIREFDTFCFYNYEWSKTNDIPNILHYFPFKMKKDGIISDIQGNLPSQQVLKNTLIGYNVIDYENKYDIDVEMEECLIIYILPERVYFNLTNVLIYNYEINPKIYPYYNYKYEYYISQNAKDSYTDIQKVDFEALNNPRELLLSKFKDKKYNGIQLNIYVTLTEIESEQVHYGFNIIKINSYYPGYDIDFEKYTKGLQDNLDVDIDNLSDKYSFTDEDIMNRLNLLQSLGSIHNMALNEKNRTTTFLDYIYNETAVSYQADNIIINDPICSDNFCSLRGKCIIVVRSMICLCNEGYAGENCHITTKNKRYLSETHLKMWNYLTNNNEFSTLPSSTLSDYNYLKKLTILVKSSTNFDDSYNELIKNFFKYIEYMKSNDLSFVLGQINLIYETISCILVNLYHDIARFRAKNYDLTENKNYKNNETIGEANLNNEQINLVYDISYKITRVIPEFLLELIKLNKNDMTGNYTGFDYTIKTVSHSFNYIEYFENLHINNRERYNSYLPFIDAYNCANYIFGSTGYSTIFLVIINYHYDPLSYHSVYSYSASYSIDAFYATQIGTKLDIKACPNFIDIYFPLNLYNTSEVEFINSHSKFLSENTEFTINDPYVTWPVYVYKNGTVSNKSRYERINEVLPMIKINCSYYNNKLTLVANITETIVSDKFYLICRTNHLSFYSVQSESSGLDYKMDGIFFYIKAPQVFICGKNWGNGCSILLLISAFLFAFLIGLYIILERTLIKTKNSLNNIKLEILKQNRLIYDEKDLIEEITKANKMNEQENMAQNLKITENDKYDKDLKQNLYLYGTKDIDYNDKAFEGGDIEEEIDEGYAGGGVFANPPRKNGFIIDDIDDLSMDDDKNSEEKETKIKKSVNIVKNKKSRQKYLKNKKPKTQEVRKENENNINKRFYKVKDYDPDRANEVNRYNYNLYKDSDFGFNESEKSDNDNNIYNKKDMKSSSSLRESIDELYKDFKDNKKKDKKKNKKEDKKEDKKENKKEKENGKEKENENMQYYDDDEVSQKNNYDYFSKYKNVIKNENKKEKKVNIQRGNYTIVDKHRKVTFVKEKYHSIDVAGFFEHIDKKAPSFFSLFWNLFLKRNIYISPFMISSTVNRRWRRILFLYEYILLQILINTFGLSIAERINIGKGAKLFIFQLINILLADIFAIIMVPLFRIPSEFKRMLFVNFRSTQQMKLLKIFKIIKEIQKKKLVYIIVLLSCTFLVTFYLSFNYCSVLYYSRWLFVGCLLLGIVLDLVLYEGLFNFLICLLYFLKNKKKCFMKPYIYLLLFRNYRNCF